MFNINLLPKEILERRRYEVFNRWVLIGGVGAMAIVLGLWALGWAQTSAKQGELQAKQDELKKYEQQARDLEVFQESERKLQAREAVAQAALAGRVNMGQLANDISLVLPDEVWLDELDLSEADGLTLIGVTPRNNGQSSDVAYKSVAKTMVRLSELPGLFDVWLSTAANDTWGSFVNVSASTDSTTVPVVKFQTSGKLTPPPAAVSATATPAGVSAGTPGAASSVSTGSGGNAK